jgi:hypothetical protein
MRKGFDMVPDQFVMLILVLAVVALAILFFFNILK